MQDTALKALDNEDKYVEGTNFKAWIFTVMRNVFINNYRKSARAAVVVARAKTFIRINVPVGGRESTQVSHILSGEISDVIDTFPTTTVYLSPCILPAIITVVQRLNVPVGTIKSRIFYARKRLTKLLSDYDYNPS